MSSNENHGDQSTQSPTEEQDSASKFTFKDESFSGNKGNITIADKIKNQYKTVNKVIRKNPIIGVLMIILFIIGILVGGYVDSQEVSSVSSNKSEVKDKGGASNKESVKAPSRELTKYEKVAMEYFLEATSPNFNIEKLKQLGGCSMSQPGDYYLDPYLDCYLLNERAIEDNNDTIPDFTTTKPGSYYIGSDIANHSSSAKVFILIPPQAQYDTNLVEVDVSTNDKGELDIANVELVNTQYKLYQFSEFINSEIGQKITTEENLDWRAVNVKSKTEFK